VALSLFAEAAKIQSECGKLVFGDLQVQNLVVYSKEFRTLSKCKQMR